MRILATGASGLVGSRFVELFASKFDILSPSHTDLDITSQESVNLYFNSNKIDVVINFAAHTNLNEAEKERDNTQGECWKLNVEGVKNLLSVAKSDQFFVQLSTDVVFPASADRPGPYLESDQPETDSSKLVWYGFAKAEAERLVHGKAAILRIANPVRAKFNKKLDYLRKTLKLYQERTLYPLFNDQQITMTFIDEACTALEKIIQIRQNRIYHAGSPDLFTPFELYKYAINQLYDADFEPKSTSIDSIENKVRYPKFGGLDVIETEKILGIQFSKWKEIVNQLIDQGITV